MTFIKQVKTEMNHRILQIMHTCCRCTSQLSNLLIIRITYCNSYSRRTLWDRIRLHFKMWKKLMIVLWFPLVSSGRRGAQRDSLRWKNILWNIEKTKTFVQIWYLKIGHDNLRSLPLLCETLNNFFFKYRWVE